MLANALLACLLGNAFTQQRRNRPAFGKPRSTLDLPKMAKFLPNQPIDVGIFLEKVRSGVAVACLLAATTLRRKR